MAFPEPTLSADGATRKYRIVVPDKAPTPRALARSFVKRLESLYKLACSRPALCCAGAPRSAACCPPRLSCMCCCCCCCSRLHVLLLLLRPPAQRALPAQDEEVEDYTRPESGVLAFSFGSTRAETTSEDVISSDEITHLKDLLRDPETRQPPTAPRSSSCFPCDRRVVSPYAVETGRTALPRSTVMVPAPRGTP
jgi:hypothetical protein